MTALVSDPLLQSRGSIASGALHHRDARVRGAARSPVDCDPAHRRLDAVDWVGRAVARCGLQTDWCYGDRAGRQARFGFRAVWRLRAAGVSWTDWFESGHSSSVSLANMSGGV